jgi:hypothetical protein
VVLFATGWRAKHVTEILRADASIVRNQFKRYRQGGIATLRRVGTDASRSSCALDAEQLVS